MLPVIFLWKEIGFQGSLACDLFQAVKLTSTISAEHHLVIICSVSYSIPVHFIYLRIAIRLFQIDLQSCFYPQKYVKCLDMIRQGYDNIRKLYIYFQNIEKFKYH